MIKELASLKKVISVLSTQRAAAVVNMVTCVVMLCQAIDMYRSGDRKIGFQKRDD